MSDFSDLFTGSDGTSLTSHTSDSSHTWTIGVGSNDPAITSNRIRNTGPGGSGQSMAAYNSCQTADGNYDVTAVMRCVTALAYAGVTIKYIVASANRYWWWWDGTKFEILKTVSGSQSSLASSAAYSLTAGNDYTMLVEVRESGGTVTLTLKANGTTVATATDTSITGAGRTGLFFRDGSSTTGLHFDSLSSSDVASSAITITSPVQYQTYQRSGTTASISITGTYTGTPTALEASFNGGAYSTIVASPSGGTFSGTLSSQAQGQGTLTVRFTNDTSITGTVADVGIGDVFVLAGDSVSEGRGTNPQSYTHATLKSTVFKESDVWANANDPIDTGTSSGSHWPLLATQIMASTGVPVAFITTGKGSTDVAGTNNTWAKNNAEYANMVTQVSQSGVNSVKGVLMHLGPNAAHQSTTTVSKATYNAAIDTLASNVNADLAGAPKINVGVMGEDTIGTPPDRRAGIDNIRGAIIEAWGDNSNVKPGPVLIDQDYSDGVHPQSDAALLEVAKRWWAAIAETYFSGSSGRGPRVSSTQWNSGRTAITVEFDRVLKTGLTFGTGCWAVSDNGTPMTVSSVAYHGSNTSAVVVTVSAAATGPAATTTITFASSNDATGIVVPLSTDITMASGAAIQIPAEPIYAQTVNEFDVTEPTLTSPSFTGTAQTTGTASVSANEANGTLYCVVTTGATPPTGAQVRVGQDSAGAAAAYSASQSITTTGTKNFSATGLTAGVTYYAHFQHRDANSNDSTVSTSTGDATDPIPSITLTLTTNGTTPAASLSSLKWAWFDQVTPDLFSAPTDKGSIETTDGSGALSISIPNSTKTSGQVGWLIVTDSDGTTTQSPAHKLFAGPVAVN